MRDIMTNGNDKAAKQKITEEEIETQGSNDKSSVDESSVDGSSLGINLGSRTDAEGQMSDIVNESCEAANRTYQRLVADGELFLELSRQLEADTKKRFREVLEGLESIEQETQAHRSQITTDPQQQALNLIKLEAEAYRDKIIAEAQQQASDHLEKCFAEAQQMLAEAELARKEVREELENQKILTDAAKIREEAHEILGDIRRQLKGPQDSPSV